MVEDLCKSKVNELEVTLRVEHHVLELDISVDDSTGMKFVYGEDLCDSVRKDIEKRNRNENRHTS